MKLIHLVLFIELSLLLGIQMSPQRCDAQVSSSDIEAAKKAALDGDVKTLASLLKAGVDPNLRSNDGAPLITFAQTTEVLKTLLEAGADPEGADFNGWTELMLFASMHNFDGVDLLLHHGAHANRQITIQGETALWAACRASHFVDEFGKPQRSALADDILTARIVKLLLNAGANVDAGPENDLSPLEYALATDKDQVAELLMRNRANVNRRPKGGLSSLSFAAGGGKHEMVHSLLLQGARPNDADSTGTTPLILAAARGDTNIVKQLIGAGANPNQEDSRGLTASDEARFMGNSESFALLQSGVGKERPECRQQGNPMSLEESLKGCFCSKSVQIVYRSDIGKAGMEFAVAGVPTHCSSIRHEITGEKVTSGHPLDRLVILRKTAEGWSRELSADRHFAKNSRYLLLGPICLSAPKLCSPVSWLIDALRAHGNGLGSPISISGVESCELLEGDSSPLLWESKDGRIRIVGDDGSLEPELAEAH